MHVLFVHPNFPAQFRCIAPRLARDYGWRCTFVTRNGDAPALPGVERIVYRRRGGASPNNHPTGRGFENGLADADGVYQALKSRQDLAPDLVVAHSGFGSSLFLPHLYDAPVLNFFEWFFRHSGQDFGYFPDVPVSETAVLRRRGGNAMILADLDNCDAGWCPSEYQRDVFPREYRGKIDVIPEGINTDLYRRRVDAVRALPGGTAVPAGTRIVTYVSRGFERTRGFDVFMKAAKRIYGEYPNVLFVCVGSDRVCYGDGARERGAYKTFRERVLAEGGYDLSKFVFTGRLSEGELVDLLSISDLHVYLTVPFVTSWSMLDAMSCSCVVLASDQACTREYITHERNGLLCDFFNGEGIAAQALKVLRDPRAYRVFGDAARLTIEEEYSVDVCLPRIKALFERVAGMGPRTPSLRAGVICRRGGEGEPGRGGDRGRSTSRVEYPAFDGTIPFGAGVGAVNRLAGSVDGSGGPGARDERPFGVPQGDIGGECRGCEGPERTDAARTVLFCWELGGGLGHLMQMRPLAEDLARAGHRVFVALRHLEGAAAVFGGAGVRFLQAPGRFAPAVVRFPRPATFAHLLANLGFDDDLELFAGACAWRNLIESVGPDLLVFDYAPKALLASRGMECRRALIGSGFCCPPDGELMPVLREGEARKIGVERLAAFEANVLACANRYLERRGAAPMERLGRLYGDVDENFLTTFPELDHYSQTRMSVPPEPCGTEMSPHRGQECPCHRTGAGTVGAGRAGAAYWGPVIDRAGEPAGGEPKWPGAPTSASSVQRGPRVFAYLKASHHLPAALAGLGESGRPTLVVAEGAGAGLRERFASDTLAFAAGPVDLARAAAECDVAVLNGGHGATAELLLAGKPIVQIPLALEQRMTADAVARIGAGESVRAGDAAGLGAAVGRVVEDPSYADAARGFANRYAAFDPARQRAAVRDRALGFLHRQQEAATGALLHA